MQTTESLNEKQWQTIYAMAQMLANEGTDANELGKILGYLRSYGHQEKAGTKFFDYLKNLVKYGKSIGHSSRTFEYYQSIEKACKQHLQIYQNDVPTMLQILGWVVRMMRYYKSGGAVGGMTESNIASSTPPISARQSEINEVVQTQQFQLEQILDAKVTNIQGNKVTYTMLETIKLTQKEPKKSKDLSVEQIVKVKVTELKEDGSIKKIQCQT